MKREHRVHERSDIFVNTQTQICNASISRQDRDFNLFVPESEKKGWLIFKERLFTLGIGGTYRMRRLPDYLAERPTSSIFILSKS